MNPAAPVRSGGSVDAVLADLLEQLTARLQAGEPVDVEACLREHPEYAGHLQDLLPALKLLANLSRSGPHELSGILSPDEGTARDVGTLGDFRLLREVGRGGMGVVYEAEQISLGRPVALKVLPFAAALNAKQLQRFKNEAQAAAHLQHTHIVPVYAVGCERGVHFYAMQFIAGQTLAAVIAEIRHAKADSRNQSPSQIAKLETHEQAGARTATGLGNSGLAFVSDFAFRISAFIRKAAQLGVQAAEALEYAHQHGVIHRDIKPANLLLDGAGQLWVTDFGLAQFQKDAGLTMTGDLVGTLRYMSPEQAQAQHALVDHRTDVYSLGATLYELLTLEPAVPGADREEVLRRLEREEPRPPRQVNAAVPRELETIVHKALAKAPAERYATAQELADDLRRFLDDKPIRARRPSLWERARRWLRRHQGLAAATVVVLAVAVVALAVSTVLVTRQRDVAEANQKEAAAQHRRAEENLRLALKAMDDIVLPVLLDLLPGDPRLEKDAQELLQKAREFYREFVTNNRDTRSLRPELASAYLRLGTVHRRLRQDAEAEAAYHAAVALWAELKDEFPDQPDYRQKLASTYLGLGVLLERTRRLPEAEKVLLQARDLWQELVAAFPQSQSYQQGLVGILLDLSSQRPGSRRAGGLPPGPGHSVPAGGRPPRQPGRPPEHPLRPGILPQQPGRSVGDGGPAPAGGKGLAPHRGTLPGVAEAISQQLPVPEAPDRCPALPGSPVRVGGPDGSGRGMVRPGAG